jgi:hypothetical protein
MASMDIGKDDLQQKGLHWLNVGRYWICATGLCVVGALLPSLFRSYAKWHGAIATDPSLADFWKTEFYLGIGRFGVELLLVVAIFFILKPRPDMFAARPKQRGGAS